MPMIEHRMPAYWRNQIFLKNLALMHDALQELAELSKALQKDDITMATANRKIQRQVEVFSCRN